VRQPVSSVVSEPAVHAVEKLSLAEFLLGSLDLEASAERTLQWLTLQVPVSRAICCVVDVQAGRLVTAAEVGAPAAAEFWLDLEDRGHPLIQLLRSPFPRYFPRAEVRFAAPLNRASFHAIPLRYDDSELSEGLIMVESSVPELHPDVAWACEVLSQQLSRLRSRQLLAETRFGQERVLLYNIINSVTDPILLTDTEGKLIIANTRAERLFVSPDDASEGWRRAAALNNMLLSAALSSTAVEAADTAGAAEASRRELLLVDPVDGSDLLFELMSSTTRDSRRGTYLVSVLRNVTDLGRASEEIEESYRRLRLAQAEVRDERHRLDLIIDSVADPILVTDPAGDIVLMNARAERLFMGEPQASEEVQRRVRTNGARFSSFVANLLSSGGGRRWKGEIGLIQPEAGEPMPVEAIAGTILSEQGELVWVVTILHDRSEAVERVRLYEQLRRASQELEAKVQAATAELAEQNELLRRQHMALEQASALKSQFLANMSHEFRTPLNAILGYTHMLLHGVSGDLTAGQRKSLSRIDSNSRHLLALINDILDITRIEAGRMPLHLTTFRVPALIDEVTAELEPIIRRSRLAVSTRLQPGLPALNSDRQKVKQIVLNLLSNALKFTPQGRVRIVVSCVSRERLVRIAVRDTGIGISDVDQARVFDDFRQLDYSPTRTYGGTGLGLSICRRLATMLEGNIRLESRLGKGSTFTLELPVRSRRKS
jgi:signal transduction histidine kinase